MRDQPTLFTDIKPLLERFHRFHQDNPKVYQQFKRFTFEAINSGRKHLSAYMISNRIRWETSVVTTGDDFKINNSFIPYYARLFVQDFPQHKEFFRMRRARADTETI